MVTSDPEARLREIEFVINAPQNYGVGLSGSWEGDWIARVADRVQDMRFLYHLVRDLQAHRDAAYANWNVCLEELRLARRVVEVAESVERFLNDYDFSHYQYGDGRKKALSETLAAYRAVRE